MAFLFFRQKFDLSDTEFAKSIHFPSCLESVNWVFDKLQKMNIIYNRKLAIMKFLGKTKLLRKTKTMLLKRIYNEER